MLFLIIEASARLYNGKYDLGSKTFVTYFAAQFGETKDPEAHVVLPLLQEIKKQNILLANQQASFNVLDLIIHKIINTYKTKCKYFDIMKKMIDLGFYTWPKLFMANPQAKAKDGMVIEFLVSCLPLSTRTEYLIQIMSKAPPNTKELLMFNYIVKDLLIDERAELLRQLAEDNNVILLEKLLITVTVDVNAANIFGETALFKMLAYLPLSEQMVNVAKLLLRYGADTSIKNNEGKTAFKKLTDNFLHHLSDGETAHIFLALGVLLQAPKEE